MRITCDDGAQGIGYTYTIGTGGSSVVALLRDHLAPRLIGRDAVEIEAIWKDLFFAHARDRGRRDHEPRARRDRHRAVGPARAGAPACRCGRSPAARSGGCRSTRPKAAGCTIRRSSSSTKSLAAQGAGLPRREDQGRQAVDRRGRRAAVGGARGGRRRVRDHGRREPGIHRGRGVPPRARVSRPRPRLVRGAAAGGGPGRPRRARGARRRCRSPSANRSTIRRTSASTSSAAPARSCRSTARASAASRRGSRSRISPRRSTSPSARTS